MNIVRRCFEVGKMDQVRDQYAGVTDLAHSIDFAIQRLVTVSVANLAGTGPDRDPNGFALLSQSPVVVQPYGFKSEGVFIDPRGEHGTTIGMSILPDENVPVTSHIEADTAGNIAFFADDEELENQYGLELPKASTAVELQREYEKEIAGNLERIRLAEELGAGLGQMFQIAQILDTPLRRLGEVKTYMAQKSTQLSIADYQSAAARLHAA